MKTIDLNADVGEGFASDAELIPLMTSVNIACGAHAGDDATMSNAVRIAKQAGVAIGAHPGHEDRENFGRIELPLTKDSAKRLVEDQLKRLQAIASEHGARVSYVKPHGALYHQAGTDKYVAAGIVQALLEVDPKLCLLGQSNTALEESAVQAGLSFFREAFADRAYLADGSLAPRTQQGALLPSDEAVIAQALGIATNSTALTIEGEPIRMPCDSLCLHGDGQRVIERAIAVRECLKESGVALRAFG